MILVKIPDRNQHDHLFTANKTNLESELNVFKKDLISITGKLYLSLWLSELSQNIEGDCCFTICSEPEGGGEFQTFQSEGEHRLEIEVVNSVYVIECTRRVQYTVVLSTQLSTNNLPEISQSSLSALRYTQLASSS